MLQKTEQWRLDMLKAADYIRQHGHCKKRLWNDKGEVCIIGAIIRVSIKDMSVTDFIEMLHHPGRICNGTLQIIFNRIGPIGVWNDAPERTKEEVISVLESIALGDNHNP